MKFLFLLIMNKFTQPYHLVTFSPWPILISFSLMNNFIMAILWFNKINFFFFFSIPCTLLCMFQWWRDVIREATFQGFHSFFVLKSLRISMILFILSEILFFFSFFWAYFHFSLSPAIDIGQLWPPSNIHPFNPFDIPLLNTIILISSGLTLTWSHYSMMMMNISESSKSLLISIFLGCYFSIIQLYEYTESSFCISDSVYGSIFFIATGFHGLHVIIGTIFLLCCYFRMKTQQFSPLHHFGFEAASWYWHFVDVVWLFLYISIYWWGYK